MNMEYKYHIGVDFHKKYSYLVVQDAKGLVVKSGQVINRKKRLEAFMKPFEGESKQAVVEATRNWTLIYDWLEPLCEKMVLANPLKVKAIAEAKIKTDKIDARILGDLLRADLIPQAYVPSEKARELRQALRERIFFVRLRTMAKNRVVTIFDRYPEETKEMRELSDMFGKEGREQLREVNVSAIDREIIDRECRLIDELNAHVKEAEQTIRTYSRGNKNVMRLKTVPGIGEFLARLIEAEIDDVNRFRNANKLASYAVLVPSTYSSGGKTHHGRLIKGNDKWLRWGLIEAVIPAIRVDEELKELYLRIKKKKGYNKAKVAVARKVLTICYKVLKEQRNYRKLNKQERELKALTRLS